ncbi:MAG: CotH kinase family protein [Gammaproteobacteria bacterium]|nr:CotH kinase family protein [Gammaproteobacteria bacterium]
MINFIPIKIRLATLLCASVFYLSACGGSDGGEVATANCDQGCVRINEAVSTNSLHNDQFGESPDWFELYNNGSETVELADYSLTDDPDIPDKWVFPAGSTLGANQYLLIWASDRDTVVNGEHHTNFKISSEGEVLYLFDPRGRLVSELPVAGLRNGTSVGQSGSGAMAYYDTPTPGSSNSSNEYSGIVSSEVVFSHDGGVNSPASVSLSGATGTQIIRYTLDGSIPTESSPEYSSSISLAGNTAVRARIFDSDHVPSATHSRTFLPGTSHDVPVVALVSEPGNFFDNDTGIYVLGDDYEPSEPNYGANFWEDWERDIHFSLYEQNGDVGVMLDAGVKIFGGWSRSYPQKSLSIYARGRYGSSEIDYPLFPGRSYDSYQTLVLRNSGDDWLKSMMRDISMTSLMESANVDIQAYRSVAVYLNGEYWGMHNMREKINEHYIASLHNVDKDTVNLLEYDGEILEGDNTDYLELVDFLEANLLVSPGNYDYIAERIDIESFIVYQVAEIYFDNQDWPGNNYKFWNSPGTKWRWILFDTDFGFSGWTPSAFDQNTLAFALEANGPDWPNPPWSTLILRRLVENESFRNDFINHFADELNSRFLPANVTGHIDSIAATIESEMSTHFLRWQDYVNVDWATEVDDMKTFANNRPQHLIAHIEDQFGLSGTYQLTVDNANPSAGDVQLNSLTIDSNSWTGSYFNDIPVTLTAVPAPGFVFSQWQGASTSTNEQIELDLAVDSTIEAVFVAE